MAVICMYAKFKIRISVFCFSGQILGYIIDNDGHVHLSNLKNFIFVMYGNLNLVNLQPKIQSFEISPFLITQSSYVKKNCW